VGSMNDYFGTDFNQADQNFSDQLVKTAILDESVIKADELNSEEKFELIFKNLL
jgi:type I restriction enzyme R subunit